MKRYIKGEIFAYDRFVIEYKNVSQGRGWYIYEGDRLIEGPFPDWIAAEDYIDTNLSYDNV